MNKEREATKSDSPMRWSDVFALISTDAFLKPTFDHIRNLTICGVVAYAGSFNLKHSIRAELLPWAEWYQVGTSMVLYALAVFLFVVNQINAFRKLRVVPVRGLAVEYFFVAYNLVATAVVMSVINGR